MTGLRLVADIGGTNARFAWVEADGAPGAVWSAPVSAHTSFTEALAAFVAEAGRGRMPGEIAIAAAGPVDGDRVQLTNAPWLIEAREVADALDGAKVTLFNDLEAVALALPYLRRGDWTAVGPPLQAVARRRLLAVNVGTGFGAATAIPVGADGWVACPSEAGHMALAERNTPEWSLLDRLNAVSVEDVLSGERFVSLYRALGGASHDADRPEDIIARAPGDAQAGEAVRLFTRWLGGVSGDLVLATASWGGVFLTGGLVESWRHVADTELFRAAFTGKGKMSQRMSTVPSVVLMRKYAALLGLARALGGR